MGRENETHLLLDDLLDAAWQVTVDSARDGGDQLLHSRSLLGHDRLTLSLNGLLLLLEASLQL